MCAGLIKSLISFNACDHGGFEHDSSNPATKNQYLHRPNPEPFLVEDRACNSKPPFDRENEAGIH